MEEESALAIDTPEAAEAYNEVMYKETKFPFDWKLMSRVLRAANDPQLKERLEGLAFEVTAAPLAETAAYVKGELAKWARVVRETGAKVD